MKPEPPRVVYCWMIGWHRKLYTSAGALKGAMKMKRYFHGTIYRAIITDSDEIGTEWTDVTYEFIYNGRAAW